MYTHTQKLPVHTASKVFTILYLSTFYYVCYTLTVMLLEFE